MVDKVELKEEFVPLKSRVWVAVFLWLLGAYGYDQALGKGLQSASAETGILMGWTLVPGLLLLLCFVVLHWYPLAGPAWEEFKCKLAALHTEEERRYLESKGYTYV